MMIIEMWILGKPNIMLQIIYGIIIYFTFWFAYLLAFSGFFIDWDMRLFIREAQAHAFGAQEHTPVHNIVIMLIRGTAYLLKLIAPRSDALLAAKVLTTGFSSASACLLFLLAANLTSNIVLAISTVLVWFILPGNFFLMRSLDDNVWANFFNTLFLYQTLVLMGCVSRKFFLIRPSLLYALWMGTCISVGINMHQQLVPLLYVFPVIVLLFLRVEYSKKLSVMLVFFAGYCGAGAIQNYFAFSSMSLTALFKKIYHTPYHGLFPHLWFFTSGSTTWEWMHRIGDGLKKSFYIDGVLLPCFLVFTLISLAGMFLTMHRWYKRQTPQDTERIITFVILLCLTAVHIPHSLLYEPWSVERWDATYPGIIVLGAIGYYAAMEEKKGRVLHAVRNIQLEFLFCAILGARLVHLLVWL